MGKLLRHRLDAIAPVLGNKGFNPLSVIAIKDQGFCAAYDEAIYIDHFRALQSALRSLELRKAEVRLGAGRVVVTFTMQWPNQVMPGAFRMIGRDLMRGK